MDSLVSGAAKPKGGGSKPKAPAAPKPPVGGAKPSGEAAKSNVPVAGGGVNKKKPSKPTKPKTGAAAAAGAAAEVPAGEHQEEEQDNALPIRGMFTKDLRVLMYGFGDSETPVAETVDLVEDILAEYVNEVTRGALEAAARVGKLSVEAALASASNLRGAAAAAAAAAAARLRVDEKDIMLLVRKDPKKYARIRELLTMNDIIKMAKKGVDAATDPFAAVPEDLAADAGGMPGKAGDDDMDTLL